MFKRIIYFIGFVISMQCYAQVNLVLNPSFEEVSGPLKCYLYGVEKFPIVNWKSASEGSIDAFSMKLSSKCAMYPLNDAFADQKPRTGSNYLGFTSIYNDKKEYREYVRGRLSEPLEVGVTYKIQFYVCLSAFASAATNNIGLAFINNKTPIFPHVDPLPMKPNVNYSGKPITESDKWTLLSFEYLATEPNLDAFIIGNFFTSEQTNFVIISDKLPIEAYMLIDDVSITKSDITFDLPLEICAGTLVNFSNVSKNGVKGTWSPDFNPYETKEYTFTTADNQKITRSITVHPSLDFNLLKSCVNYQFNIDVKFKGQTILIVKKYNWKLNGKLIANNSLNLNLSNYTKLLKNENIVELSITDVNGCEFKNSITFSGTNLCVIQKEITPNADGINDFLDLESFGGVDLKIYNRFGNLIYSKENYINEWYGQVNGEGKKFPNGEYYYQIENKTGEVLNGWIKLVY